MHREGSVLLGGTLIGQALIGSTEFLVMLRIRITVRQLRVRSISSHSRKGIPSAHMHWDSISDLATLGMWTDPGSYAYADDHLVLAYEPSFVSFVGFGV